MNFPRTVEELTHWDVSIGRDTYGNYAIITSFEGSGGCFWCGKDLEGKHRRFCGRRSGCWTHYQDHFFWGYARYECLEQYDWHCANCGHEGPDGSRKISSLSRLEVHHIIPLEGEARSMSPYNLPWNLICLCHDCHQLIHGVIRGDKTLIAKPDMFNLARANGQAMFESLRSI